MEYEPTFYDTKAVDWLKERNSSEMISLYADLASGKLDRSVPDDANWGKQALYNALYMKTSAGRE
jgi:hypothetical protein